MSKQNLSIFLTKLVSEIKWNSSIHKLEGYLVFLNRLSFIEFNNLPFKTKDLTSLLCYYMWYCINDVTAADTIYGILIFQITLRSSSANINCEFQIKVKLYSYAHIFNFSYVKQAMSKVYIGWYLVEYNSFF